MKEIISTSFKNFGKLRKDLLAQNQDTDHVFFQTNSSVLISAPHGVPQVRLGKLKVAEIGTIPVAMLLAKHTNSNLLIKTQNNNDDANFDDDCEYRKALSNIIKSQNIKYLIDIHGLAKFRPCDINLGSNFGQNTKLNQKLFNSLKSALETAGFTVSIDEPFCAGCRMDGADPQRIAGGSGVSATDLAVRSAGTGAERDRAPRKGYAAEKVKTRQAIAAELGLCRYLFLAFSCFF